MLRLTIIFAITVVGITFADEGSKKRRRRRLGPLKPVKSPKGNRTTKAKVALGKQLFFDPRLSGDNKMSCATCHQPKKAFADGLKFSKGDKGKLLNRNTQSALNVGYLSTLFWDGRATSLEEQALGPIQSPKEMNQKLDALVRELQAVEGYARQFKRIYRRSVTKKDIAKSLAAFQRTLVTRNSPFDRFLAGDKNALSPSAKAGLELFKGDAGCIRCHNGPLLSDGKYHRIGAGRPDKGRGLITKKRKDLYKFRTPPLRNISETAPYMHDGSLRSLFDVVQFYYRGVPSRGPQGLKLDIEPLVGQSFSEIDSIVAFLKSLSGKAPKVVAPKLP